jgi:hypothetical protein
MAETIRGGKKMFAITSYFKPPIWRKLKSERRKMEKKTGRRISDSEFIRVMTCKAAGVK